MFWAWLGKNLTTQSIPVAAALKTRSATLSTKPSAPPRTTMQDYSLFHTVHPLDQTRLSLTEGFSLKTVEQLISLHSSSQNQEWARRHWMKNNNIYLHTAAQYVLHAIASNIYYTARQKVKTWPYSITLLYMQMNSACKLTTSGTYTQTAKMKLFKGTSSLHYRNNKTASPIYLGLYTLTHLKFKSEVLFKKIALNSCSSESLMKDK